MRVTSNWQKVPKLLGGNQTWLALRIFFGVIGTNFHS